MNILQMRKKLPKFLQFLYCAEHATHTIDGYRKDLKGLFDFLEQNTNNAKLNKEHLIEYKKTLASTLKASTINRKIAAMNKFLEFVNLPAFKLKALKIQEHTAAENTMKEKEFTRLINEANRSCKHKIALIMLTLASTGIRISELKYITVEAVHAGKTTINSKSKIRTIFIPSSLKENLTAFYQKHNITNGTIFLGNKGQPISRPYVSTQMKKLAHSCGVDASKVFPHNLRHYFARRFLDCGNALTDLANVLGHTSVNTTRRYLRVSENIMRKQMAKVKVFATVPPKFKLCDKLLVC